MCGIVGAISQREVASSLLKGLERLEYRGYDSAGMAILDAHHAQIHRARTEGKVKKLESFLRTHPLPEGYVGIAHTRWATHGRPSESNAHPHVSEDIALVHNGIIENNEVLKEILQQKGYTFTSQTDTEIAVHFIHDQLKVEVDLLAAVQAACRVFAGSFSFGIICSRFADRLIGVCHGSPLVIGLSSEGSFLASDPLALGLIAEEYLYLEEGDIAELRLASIKVFNRDGEEVQRPRRKSHLTDTMITRGTYRHFMLKEIMEQPQVVSEALEGRLEDSRVSTEKTFGTKAQALLKSLQNIQIVACGSSFHAGLIGRYWLESIAGVSCQVEVASEFRSRPVMVPEGTLLVTISQSGETADTLAALKQAKSKPYAGYLAICNVADSSLARVSEMVFLTRAGVEVGVASTKAFTNQLIALLLLTLAIAQEKNRSEAKGIELVKALRHLPKWIEAVLHLSTGIEDFARKLASSQNALFLGRGTQYPVALEGALKLKEISYIHAEGYPGGELKHGPLALVDKNMPIIATVPNDELFHKMRSNLEEVKARGGQLLVFLDGALELPECPTLKLPSLPEEAKELAPILYTIPLQLLAYYAALFKGTDIDQPRHLAKSVTVE